MFSGIISAVSKVQKVRKTNKQMIITIKRPNSYRDLHLGDSIAVNGTCLTITNFTRDIIDFDVMNESLKKTTFMNLTSGSKVNLEQALQVNSRLDGHIVSGHVDDRATVKQIKREGNNYYLTILLSKSGLVVDRGSIAIDGVSLTITKIDGKLITVSVIPHTYNATIIKEYRLNTKVHVEYDLVGKYILKNQEIKAENHEIITTSFLAENGFY